MSFDFKINDLCPHIQTEEIHVTESDGRRVILNDIMVTSGSQSLKVKVNGVPWDRNNTLEAPAVFDITDVITSIDSPFQMVLPEISAFTGEQQGSFANSDQHVIVRACVRETVLPRNGAERTEVFLIGQNADASPAYAARSTAHSWGLVRPQLSKVLSVVAERNLILERFDFNPTISTDDLLKRTDLIRPEIERILVPGSVEPWARLEILGRFDIDPTISTDDLILGLGVSQEIEDAIRALLGDGREDAVFDVSDSVRNGIGIALGEIGPQLEQILSEDATVDSVQRLEILEKYDADPSISAMDLLDGQTVALDTTRRVGALLTDGRQEGTEWIEIPITKRLPFLSRIDFIEGEVVPEDVTAFVNGEQVVVAEVDGLDGTVVLQDAPYPCDLVEFEYCWKLKLLFVNGASGVIALDPHHLGITSTPDGTTDIVNADVRYFVKIKDGWTVEPTAGSIGGQLDIVFDTTKRTDKGRVILEDAGRFANGFNTVFQTESAPLLPFNADFFSDSLDTLLNSAPISVNGEIAIPVAFDPVLGLIQLENAPGPGQEIRISYFFRITGDDPVINPSINTEPTPTNPFEPDIIEVDYVTERTNCHRCNAMGRLDDIHFLPVNGTIVLVVTEQKLKQDLFKIVGTVITSNKFHRFYGTNFTIYIGQAGPPSFFQAQLTNEMLNAIGNLQRLQNDQFAYQAEAIDRRELINAIESVNVRRVDEIDPSIWQVDALVQSDAANAVDARILLTEEGVTLLDRIVSDRTGSVLRAIPQ